MRRLLARHPFLAASLLLLPYPAIAWGISLLAIWSLGAVGLGCQASGHWAFVCVYWALRISMLCHWATAFAWAALVCFLVALLRRRVGMPARPLYRLAATGGMEIGALLFASWMVVIQGASDDVVGIGAVAAAATAAMGSAFGIWTGTALADRFRNRGRWEMIQPVPRPGRARP